jgi:hypothetical protein
MDFHVFQNIEPQTYLISGWRTQSEIPLTGVPTLAPDSKSVDILIQIAAGQFPLEENAGRILFQHSAERSLFGIPGVADFEVNGGRQIRVWPAAGAMPRDIEVCLLGPVWASLYHQRGVLPLHASAIVTGKGITAFAGHSGAGKSTTAASMGLLGFELVADDILPITFDQNSVPGAWPYLRRLKLQRDSIAELALTPTELVSKTLDGGKFLVQPQFISDNNWGRLERVYLLEIDPRASRVMIDQITGAEAIRALVDQTYHFDFILCSGRFREHLALCTQLASRVAIYRLRRPASFRSAIQLGRCVSEHINVASNS